MLIDELPELLGTLAAETPAHVTWPDIRKYLEGMAASMRLHDDDPLSDRGARWWMQTEAKGGRAPRSQPPTTHGPSPAGRALAALAVLHLSHPAWLGREAPCGSWHRRCCVMMPRPRMRWPGSRRPRCIGGCAGLRGPCDGRRSETRRTARTPLASLDATLAGHRNLLLRGLRRHHPRRYRPLPALYGLILPVSVDCGSPPCHVGAFRRCL